MATRARNSGRAKQGRGGGRRSSPESAAATPTPDASSCAALDEGLAPPDPADRELTPLQARFCDEFVIDLDAAAAYGRAVAPNQPNNLKHLAWQMRQLPHVARRIQQLIDARRIRTQFEGDAVLLRFWQIASADPRELVEYRRTACRHCYGAGGKYQMTQREMDERYAEYERGLEGAKKKAAAAPAHLPVAVPDFDELGGIGWDPRRDPNADCPECFGQGVEREFVHDTRKLSPKAVALYAGMKRTKDGLQVLMHSQTDALVNVGKLLGQYIEKHEHAGALTLEQILTASNEVAL